MTLTYPGARRLGAGAHAHNRPTVRTVGVVAPGAGFSRFKLCVCQVHVTRVRFVDAETISLKRELLGGLTSSFFDRLRCRKSPARGFWTL
jgi:hypothetical protein